MIISSLKSTKGIEIVHCVCVCVCFATRRQRNAMCLDRSGVGAICPSACFSCFGLQEGLSSVLQTHPPSYQRLGISFLLVEVSRGSAQGICFNCSNRR
jgi:hypothetical protein